METVLVTAVLNTMHYYMCSIIRNRNLQKYIVPIQHIYMKFIFIKEFSSNSNLNVGKYPLL